MIFTDQRRLFTSAEVCRACGISRTSLFRLEEIGFLSPYSVNPETGYRYYDLQNITAVGQFQRMQKIGLSKKEIVDVYLEQIDSKEFLKTQRQKLNMMKRFLDEYEYLHDHNRIHSGAFVTFPAVTCYCSDFTAYSTEEAVKHNYIIHERCAREGYQLLGSEPLFAVIDKDAVWENLSVSGVHYTICIPVSPDTAPDPNIRSFPETHGFSGIVFGDYSVIPEYSETIRKEIGKRNLKPSGSPRIIMHIGAYAGKHYNPDDFCYEFVIPIT
ncbi:MAG: MerR family transcriptional regulator [Lachnospiraceae bacterium]|nr:MerR family transcriptional regulator [Lachnospiraceae bacterium]